MAQNFRFNDSSFANRSGGNDSSIINPMMMDSPVARDRFSRFSRLTDTFNQSKLSHSMLNFSQSASLLNESSATVCNQTGTELGNVSDISSAVNLSSVLHMTALPTLRDESLVPAGDNASEDDEMARLAIFQSFFEYNQQLQKPLEVFDLIEKFDQTCEENMLAYKEMLDSKVRSDNESAYLGKFSSLIRLERNTWRLVGALYADRLGKQAAQDKLNLDSEVENMEFEEDLRLRLSDAELVERTLERNAMLREMQIVIDWLESVYDEEPTDKVQFYSDGPVYWENTLHAQKVGAKNQASPLGLSKGRQYCSEMDPDASIRTGMPLHDLDKEDENRLFHHMFKLIRAGKLQDGKDIAERQGYFWLSAALEGWILHHDPNYKPEGINEVDLENMAGPPSPDSGVTYYSGTTNTEALKVLADVNGNPYRDLWKHTAWKCAKMEGTNLHERAIFAVFSGNRSVLIPLCSKWMDKLWAYYKCSIDVHLENLLIDTSIPKPDHLPRNNIEMPDAYWDNKLSPEEIFHELTTQTSGSLTGLQPQIEEEYHQEVEKCLILGKVDQLIDHLYEWCKTIQANREKRAKEATQPPSFGLFSSSFSASNRAKEEEMAKVVEPNLLRFFAHLAISLSNLHLIVDEKMGELYVEILEIYIGYLIEYKLVELVAFYTLYLPEHRQVRMFATLLEGIDEVDLRPVCITVAKQSKLNLSAILTLVVENIRTGNYSYQTKPAGSLGAEANQEKPSSLLKQPQIPLTSVVTDEDLRKISALDWLLLDRDNPQYVELLYQTNALIRAFLLERKLDQAIQTFEKLPSDISDLAFQEFKRAHTTGDLSITTINLDNVMREYFGNKTFFEANDSFQKWNHYLYNSKPREPTKPKQMNRLADRVAFEQAVKQYEQEMEVWQQQINTQAGLTSEKLLAYLDFPGGIWVNSDDFSLLDEELLGDGSDVDVHSNLESVSLATPRLVTEIEEAIDQDEEDVSINSDIEIQSVDLRRNGEGNMVFKLQRERKQKEWTARAVQQNALRRIYVPQFVFLLYSVYADSGNLTECVRIADIVADENRSLHSTFTNEQIVDLLNKIREASITILNQGLPDPLGYVAN